jgi:prepilin-type N-terminal cleavage/methylation domain-containing protein
MTHPSPRSRADHGFTLVEIMVALVILLVGILGLMRLQMFGLHANQASRTHTSALQLARELALGLEQLPWSDSQVAPTGAAGPAPVPSAFGRILDGNVTSYRTWSDSTPVPGARLDSQITERDPDGTPTFKRRWTVWNYTDTSGRLAGGKLIAVSVVFHERTSPIAYEVVYYGFQGNPGAVIANAGAYQ